MLLACSNESLAVPVDFTYTADNEVRNVWYQSGSTTVAVPLGPGATDWGQTDSFTLNLMVNTPYHVIWQAANWSWEGAPGGFLAEVSSPTPLLGDGLLSSAQWEVAFVQGSVAVPDWATLAWSPATEYGANNDPSTIWYGAAWGPIASIAGEAQWLWTALNFADPGAPGDGDSVFIRVAVEPTAPVPEPSTLLITASGFATWGAMAWRRHRRG